MSDECIKTFENIKISKAYRFAIFMIVGNRIEIEQIGKILSLRFRASVRLLTNCIKGSRDASYDEYLNQLKTGDGKQCRYGVYDYEYTYQHQGTDSVTWIIKVLNRQVSKFSFYQS